MNGRQRLPAEGVMWDSHRREHIIVMVLDATQADGLADALGPSDVGGVELRLWAAEARRLDEDTAWVPVGVPDEG